MGTALVVAGTALFLIVYHWYRGETRGASGDYGAGGGSSPGWHTDSDDGDGGGDGGGGD